MSSLSTLPKGDSAWLLRKAVQRIMQQVSVLETNIGTSTTGNSANTQIIFNDAGTLRGDAGLTYNAATDALTAGAATISGDLTVDTSTLKVDSTNDRVGIGIAAPAYRLHVQGTASLQLVLQSNDTNANAKEGTVNVRHYTNAEEPVSAVGGFSTSTANEVYLGGGFSAGNAATSIGFYTAANNTTTIGTERARFNSTGNLAFANGLGIDFSAVTGGTGTATGNVLNDYEEGTFTSSITFGGGSTGITYSQQTLRYTKVGRVVSVQGYISLTNKGSSTGQAIITGLPFSVANANSAASAVSVWSSAITTNVGGTKIQAFALINTATIQISSFNPNGSYSNLTDANFANNSELILNLTYTV